MTAIVSQPEARIELVRGVIRQVTSERRVNIPNQLPFELKNCISEHEGEWLAKLVSSVQPSRTLETGMGTGLSGAYICLGLLREAEKNPGKPLGKHTAIDPGQTGNFWRGAGLAVREQAGLTEIFEHIGEPSEFVLPRLVASGEKIQFGFIDAYHRFEAALVEFYYLDRLLSPGGLCVIDDADWPSVWRVVQFAIQHRGYEWVDGLTIDRGPVTRPWGWKLRYRRWRQFRRQGWPAREALFRQPYQAVALRKVKDDDRAEDFWVPF